MAVSSPKIGAALTASRYMIWAAFGLALGFSGGAALADEAKPLGDSMHRQIALSGEPTKPVSEATGLHPVAAMQNAATSLRPVAAIVNGATSLRPVAAIIDYETPLRPTAALQNAITSPRPMAAIVNSGTLRPVAALANGQTSLRPVAAIVNNGASLHPVAAMANSATSLRPVAMLTGETSAHGLATIHNAEPTLGSTKAGKTAQATSLRAATVLGAGRLHTRVALASSPMGKALAIHSTVHWAKQHPHAARPGSY